MRRRSLPSSAGVLRPVRRHRRRNAEQRRRRDGRSSLRGPLRSRQHERRCSETSGKQKINLIKRQSF